MQNLKWNLIVRALFQLKTRGSVTSRTTEAWLPCVTVSFSDAHQNVSSDLTFSWCWGFYIISLQHGGFCVERWLQFTQQPFPHRRTYKVLSVTPCQLLLWNLLEVRISEITVIDSNLVETLCGICTYKAETNIDTYAQRERETHAYEEKKENIVWSQKSHFA